MVRFRQSFTKGDVPHITAAVTGNLDIGEEDAA